MSEILTSLAANYPLAADIFSVIGGVVTLASAVVGVFPALNRNGKAGRVITALSIFSIFTPKFKPATPDKTGATDSQD